VTRGYHCPPVQQPYFNTVSLDGTVPDDVLIMMIDHAYAVVVGKLPKKAQKDLEGMSGKT
jgi:predicted DNA-binding protein (MmcQ/YjbR family)